MLDPSLPEELDERLVELLSHFKKGASYAKIADMTRRVITDYQGKSLGNRTVFRANWERSWEASHEVYSWILELPRLTDRQVKALHGVHTEMVRLLLESDTSFHKKKHLGRLQDALCEYLALRGYDVSGQGGEGTGQGSHRKRRRGRREPAPETLKRRAEREQRQKQNQEVFEDWTRESWGSYQDYVDWKNENLPEGWKKLTCRDVQLALQAHKARLKRQGRWPPDGLRK